MIDRIDTLKGLQSRIKRKLDISRLRKRRIKKMAEELEQQNEELTGLRKEVSDIIDDLSDKYQDIQREIGDNIETSTYLKDVLGEYDNDKGE